MDKNKSKNKMGLFELTVITIMNMVSDGILLLPANLAQIGTITILSWIITSLGSFALAYSFAQCGIYTHYSDGMGGYARYSYGKAGSFMANYSYSVSLIIANVADAILVVSYASIFLGVKIPPLQTGLLTVFVICLATVLNFGGARITGKIDTYTSWGLVIPILGISILGWFWFDPNMYIGAWNPHNLPFGSAATQSISLTLWSFLGFESACANMNAVENPKKNVPIACVVGTIVAAVINIVSTNVIAGIVPNAALAKSSAPFGLAFATIFNPTIGKIATGLMVIACFGSLISWQFTAGQVFKSSADQGYFPKVFSKVTSKDTPVIGMTIILIVQVFLSLMTISPSLTKQFSILVKLAVVTNLIPYLLSMGSLDVMQRINNVPRKKIRLNNFICLVASIYSLYALFSSGPDAMLYGCIATFAGWTLYGFISHRFDLKNTGIEEDAAALQK